MSITVRELLKAQFNITEDTNDALLSTPTAAPLPHVSWLTVRDVDPEHAEDRATAGSYTRL